MDSLRTRLTQTLHRNHCPPHMPINRCNCIAYVYTLMPTINAEIRAAAEKGKS